MLSSRGTGPVPESSKFRVWTAGMQNSSILRTITFVSGRATITQKWATLGDASRDPMPTSVGTALDE